MFQKFQNSSIKDCISQSQNITLILSSLSILETISDCNREENAASSIFDSCSQKWPYFNADYMVNSKIECNNGFFYDTVDKLSCCKRCDIVYIV